MDKKVYIDVETTALMPGQIAQIAYLVEQEDGKVKPYNQYFTVDYADPATVAITGLSMEVLAGRSNGIKFEDKAAEIFEDLNGSTLIAHNVQFDHKFVKAELYRTGRGLIVNELCTMKNHTDIVGLRQTSGRKKFPKLEEVLAYYGVSREYVRNETAKVFGSISGEHDARYDVVGVYIIQKLYEQRQGMKV